MRSFLRDGWKAIVVILLPVVLATFAVAPGAAPVAPSLAERLRAHVTAIASSEHNTANPQQLEQAARYIETTLRAEGYAIQHQEYEAGGQKMRNIEVSVANVAPHAKPERIFIVGAHYGESASTLAASAPGAPSTLSAGPNDNGSAAVLELARLLRNLRPSQGTEIKFVFFVNEEPPWLSDDPRGGEIGSMRHARRGEGMNVAGDFIAFAGTLQSSRLVQQALAAFQGPPDFPAHGLAAPDYVQGVTLSDHASYNRFGYPAIMITDTAFGRYPYYETGTDGADDTPDKVDYTSVARVVSALAHTIEALAAGQQS